MPYYAVRKGRKPGVYSSWAECKAQVDHFPGPIYKKFATEEEAWSFVGSSAPTQANPKENNSFKKDGFDFNVSGKGKARAEKLAIVEASMLSMSENDCAVVINPEKAQNALASEQQVALYTDGACSGNPGKGGYGYAVVINDDLALQGSGGLLATTNNQMELTAVIEGLKQIPRTYAVAVYSDSSYVVNAFNKNWISNWQRRNWVKPSGEPVANQELWEALLSEINEIPSVQFIWVKGHAGNKYNELCDRLAVKAIKSL